MMVQSEAKRSPFIVLYIKLPKLSSPCDYLYQIANTMSNEQFLSPVILQEDYNLNNEYITKV